MQASPSLYPSPLFGVAATVVAYAAALASPHAEPIVTDRTTARRCRRMRVAWL